MTESTNRRPRLRHRDGFTLVEMLMVMVVSLIFMAALAAFFFNGTRVFSAQQTQGQADASVRETIGRFTRDVRQAITPNRSLRVPPVAYIDATRLTLYSEVGNRAEGIIATPRPQKVEYQLVGTQLIRSSVDPVGSNPPYIYGSYTTTDVLAENVQNGATAVFQAYDSKGLLIALPVAQPQRIASIRIYLKLGQKTGVSDTTTEISTNVTLRNRLTAF